jgi:hypothetical protein
VPQAFLPASDRLFATGAFRGGGWFWHHERPITRHHHRRTHGWGDPSPLALPPWTSASISTSSAKPGPERPRCCGTLILQHIAWARVGVIDPHGDLAEELLNHIPPKRADHLVYFNPGDIGISHRNECHRLVAPDDRHLVASGIVAAFKGIWRDSWGPRLEYILYNACPPCLECRNQTLLGVNRLLTDETTGPR